jgi:outer membrane protein assembly factor BamB
MKHSILLTISLTFLASAQAGNWPQWRGPAFNGCSDEKNLPSVWSETENIAWTADLPGAAASTPIVWEDHVFLSGVDAAKDTLQAYCFRRADGKLLWQHDIAKGMRRDDRSNYASASPATDGKVAVFFFGNGDLACFNFDGSRRWALNVQKEYGPFAFLWTFSSSPLLYDGRLYLQVLQRDTPVGERGLKDRPNESYLLALEPETAKKLWRQVRPSRAVAESREAFSTPVPMENAGSKQLLVVGGDALTCHAADTGKELWRWDGWNPSRIGHWRLVPSPVAGDGVVLACAPKGDPVYAIKAGGSGVLDAEAVAWNSRTSKRVSSDVPTPAFYDGDYFVLSDVRKGLSRIEPRTGKVKWSVATPGRDKYEASPLAADGKIYLINFGAQVAVIDAANGEVLRVIQMHDPGNGEVTRASIVAAHGQLFIRTARKLYCVGKPSPKS